MLAVLALVLSFFTLAQPVRADHVDGATVQLHQDLGDGVSGENPGEFEGDESECAGVEEGTTLFHFVANNLADGTDAESSELHAFFEGAGEVVVPGYFPSGSEQPTVHFDVVIDGDDTLLDAFAVFNLNQTEDAKLLLSHICFGGEGEVEADLTLIKQDDAGGTLADVGFTLEGGMEVFTDAEGQIVFEDLAEGEFTLTETTAPEGCESGGTLTVTVDAEGNITVTDDDEMDTLAIVSFDAETNVLVLSNDCEDEVENGLLEVEKFFCPTEGESRVEFDVFGPVTPQSRTMGAEEQADDCTVGADVSFTLWSIGEEAIVVDDDLRTDENGIIEIELAPGNYRLCENSTDECVDFAIGEGQVTAIVVVNFVAAPEGQLKILKYFCEAEEDSVEFFPEGQAPNLENCEPGDALFTIDDGDAFSTTGGIAVVNLDVGTGYVLTEVGSQASTEFDIAEGEITSIIVLNNVAGAVEDQGQIKVLKYECEADEADVQFFMEGEAPNLEDCDPADAEFSLDGGAAFSTTDGIAIVWADEGTHTLAEVSTGASTSVDVVAGEVTTVIVLNMAEEDVGGNGGDDDNGVDNGLEGGVLGGQGGPGSLPDTATGNQPDGFPAALLALLTVAGLAGAGAANLHAVRSRMR